MYELIQKFIEKECLIYTYDHTQLQGVIKQVTEGAALIDNKGNLELINLQFISRIREYPRSKNGKKKSVVLD